MPKTNKKSDNQAIKQVVDIIKFMGENHLAEIDLETSQMKLKLKKNATPNVIQQNLVAPNPELIQAPLQFPEQNANNSRDQATSIEKTREDNCHKIASPMSGTFYSAPSPNSDPYVKVGQTVSEGQTVCIIEAMKMMNEIKSDKDGKITKIVVNNAELVDKGSALFHVE